HAEHRWLSHAVVPVLLQVEHRESLPEEQLGAALAYLEILSIEASQRAAETDAAYAELDAAAPNGDRALHGKARGYYAAVRSLRTTIAHHIARLIAAPSDPCPRRPIVDRHASS
ncbi:MAG TPA: hypothetical protein VES97_10685, partial [Solirubrobacteraceae bacterium]|nr:hypothetical protein [Solirubrobacteraceae bacterium]